MFEQQWLYRDADGATQGPVPHSDFLALIQSGELRADSQVREYGPSGEWGVLAGVAPDLVGATAKEAAAARGAWRATPSRPWRRYLARFLDYIVVGSVVFFILGIALFLISEPIYYEFVRIVSPQFWMGMWNTFFTVLLTTLVLALLIGLTGYTPGKWIFGVKVVADDGRPIGVVAGLRRELTLWVTGLAAGLPLISYLAAIFSYRQLTGTRPAFWDRQVGSKVIYRPAGRRQTLLMVLGLVIIALGRVLAFIPASV